MSYSKLVNRFSRRDFSRFLAGNLFLGGCSLRVQAACRNEVLDQCILPLLRISLRDSVATAFDQMLFRSWYGRDVNFGLTVDGWSQQKKDLLNSSSVDKRDIYRDADIKIALTEYERLKARFDSEYFNYFNDRCDWLEQKISWWLNSIEDSEIRLMLKNPDAKKVWDMHVLHSDISMRLVGLARVVLQIAPVKFLKADASPPSGIKLISSSSGQLDELFVFHGVADFLIHSSVLNDLLPSNFDLASYRKLDIELHEKYEILRRSRAYWSFRGVHGAVNALRDLAWDVLLQANTQLGANFSGEKFKSDLSGIVQRLKKSVQVGG